MKNKMKKIIITIILLSIILTGCKSLENRQFENKEECLNYCSTEYYKDESNCDLEKCGVAYPCNDWCDEAIKMGIYAELPIK